MSAIGALKYSQSWQPYGEGRLAFTLKLFESKEQVRNEATHVCYQLWQGDQLMFSGCDYQPSPDYELFSDRAAHDLMRFLCATRHDADADFFKSYTQTQIWFSLRHAEALWNTVQAWYEFEHPEDMEEYV